MIFNYDIVGLSSVLWCLPSQTCCTPRFYFIIINLEDISVQKVNEGFSTIFLFLEKFKIWIYLFLNLKHQYRYRLGIIILKLSIYWLSPYRAINLAPVVADKVIVVNLSVILIIFFVIAPTYLQNRINARCKKLLLVLLLCRASSLVYVDMYQWLRDFS